MNDERRPSSSSSISSSSEEDDSPPPKRTRRQGTTSTNKRKRSAKKKPKEKKGADHEKVKAALDELEAKYEGKVPEHIHPTDSKGRRLYSRDNVRTRRVAIQHYYKHVHGSPSKDSGLWFGRAHWCYL